MKLLFTFLLAIGTYLGYSADPFVVGNPTTGKTLYNNLSTTDTFHVYVTFNKSITTEEITFIFRHPSGGSTYRTASTKVSLGKNPAIAASNAWYRFIITGDAVKTGTYNIEVQVNSVTSSNKSLDVTFNQTTTSIIEELTPEDLNNTEYYTIQGVKVIPNTPGIYIRVRGYRRETILIN